MQGGFFNRLFKNVEPKTVAKGNDLIGQILDNLPNDSRYQRLRYLISQRKNAFTAQIDSIDNQNSKQPFIDAYVHFAQSLKNYFENPGNVCQHIKNYHSSSAYYHVGGMHGKWSYSFADKLTDYLLKFALLLLIAGVVASPFNLSLAIIPFGIALTLMAPSFIYAYAVTGKNIKKVQAEETDLFLEAQKMIDPEQVHEQKPEESSLLLCC